MKKKCSNKNGWLGKHHSEKTKEKIRKQRLGKGMGKENPHWKGGRIMIDGYVYVYSPNHPNCTKDGYMCEHRLVMETKLQRLLKKKEVVHHINHIKTDNEEKNLMLFSSSGRHYIKEHSKRSRINGRFI